MIVPSLSMDPRELAKISGFYHYEERQLVNLMLLRQPRTKVIYVTSQALDPVVVDYYLSLLPGVPPSHARKRLVMLDCNDRSLKSLSTKIVERPRLLERIRAEILDPARAHIVCFNSTPAERTLAVRLGLPLSVDPDLSHLGTKSGCRKTFREAGVDFPFGFEDLSTPEEMARGLAAIKRRDPGRGAPSSSSTRASRARATRCSTTPPTTTRRCRRRCWPSGSCPLPGLRFEAPGETWENFAQKYAEMQGVVEAFVEGEHKTSPSAQCRVSAIGEPQVISTHDQVLGGPSGQVFLGCTFPADDAYRMEIQSSGYRVAEVLGRKGVIGRFGIDYVSVRGVDGSWRHMAIEVNLRKGGTTHPFLTLKFLTGGNYNLEDGLFYSQNGHPKYYYATDTLQAERYRGLRAEDLLDIAVYHDLHFHGPTERGVVFHLIGALSEFGKLGLVSIGDNPQQAKFKSGVQPGAAGAGRGDGAAEARGGDAEQGRSPLTGDSGRSNGIMERDPQRRAPPAGTARVPAAERAGAPSPRRLSAVSGRSRASHRVRRVPDRGRDVERSARASSPEPRRRPGAAGTGSTASWAAAASAPSGSRTSSRATRSR
ncbi:MAG: peptide ligase PGM1-related protein [Myxococcota bacterium]